MKEIRIYPIKSIIILTALCLNEHILKFSLRNVHLNKFCERKLIQNLATFFI